MEERKSGCLKKVVLNPGSTCTKIYYFRHVVWHLWATIASIVKKKKNENNNNYLKAYHGGFYKTIVVKMTDTVSDPY